LNCLATVAPEVAAQWHPTKNGDVTPSDVVANENRKYWFKCDVHWDHEWEATLCDRASGGTGCPCCVNRKASETNSLASLKPAAAARWHPTKNGDLTPDDVVAIRGGRTVIFPFAGSRLYGKPVQMYIYRSRKGASELQNYIMPPSRWRCRQSSAGSWIATAANA
jgi:hypothetical protein